MLGFGSAANFFRYSLATALAATGVLATQRASAASTSGAYKALVCLYLAGGNDSHNWLVPVDAEGHSDYRESRGNLALALTQLRAITSTGQANGRAFGMPLELEPLRTLYEAGRCAWVANVGALNRPMTKADFLAGRHLPYRLFSHNDQASIWQSLQPEGAQAGWGGTMGDLFMGANGTPAFTAVSTCGNAVFLSGNQLVPYQIGASGVVGFKPLEQALLHGSPAAAAALRHVMKTTGSADHSTEYSKANTRALDALAGLKTALAATASPILPSTTFYLPSGAGVRLSTDSLAHQLRTVAHLIAAAPRLGMQRQVFMVSLGGFDTHANQLSSHALLTARVAHSVGWFMNSLGNLGLQNNVTLFTASDFGRTLSSNGQGSDHGWGSHQMVVGGAVNGRRIYGRMPELALGGPEDVGSGRLLPSTGITPYAATLARWMGLSDSEVALVFPDSSQYSDTQLGFV